MKNLFDRLEAKLDRVDEKLDAAMVVQARQEEVLEGQHKSLVEHMRRTDLLEDSIKPLKGWQDRADGALKLVALIAVLFEIYHNFHG